MSAECPVCPMADIIAAFRHFRKVPKPAVSRYSNDTRRHLVGDCAQASRGKSDSLSDAARIDGEGMPWRRPLKLLLTNHSIISVTRTKNDSGTVKPSAFAVVLLKTRSNLSGCSTRMSAGLEPRRILST